jgi:hypothetical protein
LQSASTARGQQFPATQQKSSGATLLDALANAMANRRDHMRETESNDSDGSGFDSGSDDD